MAIDELGICGAGQDLPVNSSNMDTMPAMSSLSMMVNFLWHVCVLVAEIQGH